MVTVIGDVAVTVGVSGARVWVGVGVGVAEAVEVSVGRDVFGAEAVGT